MSCSACNVFPDIIHCILTLGTKIKPFSFELFIVRYLVRTVRKLTSNQTPSCTKHWFALHNKSPGNSEQQMRRGLFNGDAELGLSLGWQVCSPSAENRLESPKHHSPSHFVITRAYNITCCLCLSFPLLFTLVFLPVKTCMGSLTFCFKLFRHLTSQASLTVK